MSFAMPRAAYDRYMGRYADRLATAFAAFAGVQPNMRVLDVGCGPGALTEVLADTVGGVNVAAADPSESFVAACSERVPGADVRRTTADALPWPEASFDLVASQLVLNFLPDADAGLDEMCRVAKPAAAVAACTWDYANKMRMLRTFWDAALELDPDTPDEAQTMRWCTEAELADLWTGHGLTQVETAAIEVTADYTDFDDFWVPFTLGVGPGGAYLAEQEPKHQDALRASSFRRLGEPVGPFTLTAQAWAVRGLSTSLGYPQTH